jgi:predicted aminopeptidase
MVALTVLTGCRAGYIAKVGVEHLRFVSRAVPISEEIARTEDPERREKLELVLAAREFAASHGLAPAGSYEKISETAGLARAHVVTAAYKERLEPYVWRYPVVGTMPYRGYFERADADAFAAALTAKGLDTYVVEAAGYSTLGWFDDPLPSGVLESPAWEVVGFVFHELVHRRLFVSGEIDFNETLASAVEMRLTARFFAERGDEGMLLKSLRRYANWLDGAHACDALADRLQALFDDAAGRPLKDVLAERRAIYAASVPRLKAVKLLPLDAGVDRLNNAVLLAWYRYRRRAPEFEAYFERFESVDAALGELERRLDAERDPWLALAAQ